MVVLCLPFQVELEMGMGMGMLGSVRLTKFQNKNKWNKLQKSFVLAFNAFQCL